MANIIVVKTPAETALADAFGGLNTVLPGSGGAVANISRCAE